MRLIHAYLIAYFGLIAGAVIALWRAQILARVPPITSACALLVTVGLGVALAFVTKRPRTR
jgi:hypothetical protein